MTKPNTASPDGTTQCPPELFAAVQQMFNEPAAKWDEHAQRARAGIMTPVFALTLIVWVLDEPEHDDERDRKIISEWARVFVREIDLKYIEPRNPCYMPAVQKLAAF